MEIKFRGKAIDGKWVFGDLIHLKRMTVIRNYDDLTYSAEILPETIGQFIGVKDTEGNELYEGDIIEYEDSHVICTENGTDYDDFKNIGRVFYDVEYGRYNVTNHVHIDVEEVFSEFKILGNIYDNAEILKDIEELYSCGCGFETKKLETTK